MQKHLNILRKTVGCGEPCFIIAEIAQAHDGSLGIAHSYIDAVADAGADAVKFQTHIASAESSLGEPFRVNFSYEDPSRYDYWKRMEFTKEQWAGLAEHCKERGLIFLSSPFSLEAVELLSDIGVPAWKVGSGDVNNPILLDSLIETKAPILLSSGMNTWKEIDFAVKMVTERGSPMALFQCTSKYPTQFVDVGLNVIEEMQRKYNLPIGLSDHSGSTFPSLAAISKGINLLELHVVFDKRLFGPDTSSSITLDELERLVEFRDAFYVMQKNPVDKDGMATNLYEMRNLFNKSVVLKEAVEKGTLITKEMLVLKKPGVGVPADKLEECVGKIVKRSLPKDYMLALEDFE